MQLPSPCGDPGINRRECCDTRLAKREGTSVLSSLPATTISLLLSADARKRSTFTATAFALAQETAHCHRGARGDGLGLGEIRCTRYTQPQRFSPRAERLPATRFLLPTPGRGTVRITAQLTGSARSMVSRRAPGRGAATVRSSPLCRTTASSHNLVFDLSTTHDRHGSSAKPHSQRPAHAPKGPDAPLRIETVQQRKLRHHKAGHTGRCHCFFYEKSRSRVANFLRITPGITTPFFGPCPARGALHCAKAKGDQPRATDADRCHRRCTVREQAHSEC